MLSLIIPPIIIIVAIAVLVLGLSRSTGRMETQSARPEGALRAEAVSEQRFSERGALGVRSLMQKLSGIGNAFLMKIRGLFSKMRRERQREETETFPAKTKEQDISIRESAVIHTRRILTRPKAERRISIDEKRQRPMVADAITRPETEEKRKLADTLIERIAPNPQDLEAYERLGNYYIEQENFSDAQECFKQVLKLSPGHHRARIVMQQLRRLPRAH